jgi:ATP-binding cassette, subfamily C (CFTR/MRP), member 1
VQVNADFTWETVLGEKKEKVKADENSDEKKTNDEVKSRKKSKKTKSQNLLPSTIDESKITDSTEKEEEPPFSFSDLRFEVPKGAFIAIVGRVGCGKVSQGVNCP